MTAIRNVGESQRAAQRDMGHGAAKWGLEGDVSDEGCAPVGGVHPTPAAMRLGSLEANTEMKIGK